MTQRIPTLDEFINESQLAEGRVWTKTTKKMSKKEADEKWTKIMDIIRRADRTATFPGFCQRNEEGGKEFFIIKADSDLKSDIEDVLNESQLDEGAKSKFVLYTNPNNVTNRAYTATGPDVAEVLRDAKKYSGSYEILHQGRGDDNDIKQAQEMFSQYKFN